MKDLKEFEIPYNLEEEISASELVEIHIGDVNLPTGRIIAADAFSTDGQPAFARTVEPDKYPVFIHMAKMDELHHRVAYAKIRFRPEKATRWILALTEDLTEEELNDLGEDEFYGFPVDTGIACFLDVEANPIYIAKMDEFQEKNEESDYYDEVLAEEFREYSGKNNFSRALGDWNDHHPDEASDNNVVMFSSGWGDGYYPAYWGLNENGDAVELVIDFLINDFDDEEEEGDDTPEDGVRSLI